MRASERHNFDDKDAEIEHLRKELAILQRKALISDDIQAQNETLQDQLEAAYRTNEEQLHVNEQQAELIIQQADQISNLNDEKKLLTE